MLSRSTLRSSHQVFTCARCTPRRSYSAATSTSFAYESSDAAGTKLVSRNVPGATSTLAVVAKAGTRYQWLPGLSEGLQNFAFKNTQKRFAVRIVRETELLGSTFFSYRTREAVVYGAKFLREDLPYFVELLGEVASETKYQQYMIDEVVQPTIAAAQSKFISDSATVALDAAHSIAFHRGLGNSLYPVPHLVAEEVEAFAAAAYTKSNIAFVGSGVETAEFSKWGNELLKGISSAAPAGLPSLESATPKYYGGEQRISASGSSTIVLAFPGTSTSTGSAYKPEIEVLATLLGGQSSVKWSTGSSVLGKALASHSVSVTSDVAKYSDSGLLYVSISGSAKAVAAAAKDTVAALKSLGSASSEDVKKAIAQAKFKAYEAETSAGPVFETIGLGAINGKVVAAEESLKGISSVSESAVTSAAKKLLEGKATVIAVGDLSQLPFAEELGLTV